MTLWKFVREHRVGALLIGIPSAAIVVADLLNVVDTVASAQAWAGWLAGDQLGRKVMILTAVVGFVTYWIMYPWAIKRSQGYRIAAHADRIAAIGRACPTESTSSFTESACDAGAEIFKSRDLGAFAAVPALEARLDTLRRGQSNVQISSEQRLGPAKHAEYQAFFVVRFAAYAALGATSNNDPSSETVRSGCETIARLLREGWPDRAIEWPR